MNRVTRVRQGIHTHGISMEQSVVAFEVKDLETALDCLLDHFKGQDVMQAVLEAMISRTLERNGGRLPQAATELGMSKRMMYYYHRQLKGADDA